MSCGLRFLMDLAPNSGKDVDVTTFPTFASSNLVSLAGKSQSIYLSFFHP